MAHKSWHLFKKEDISPPRTLRVAKRWLAEGTIQGKPVKNSKGEVVDILVDMDHWHGETPHNGPRPLTDLDQAALALLSGRR